MSFTDRVRALWGGSVKPKAIASTANPQAGIMDGTDGRPSLVWARYDARPFTAGYLSGWQPSFGTPGSEISRERSLVASVNLDLLFSNPIVAALVETFATYAIGTGLTLSSRPNAESLGISPEDARALAHQIETAWAAWAGNPVECDASGRHTLHQLATANFKSYLLTGEAVFLVDWKRGAGAATGTKINLLDSRQLDQSITRVIEGASITQGCQFDRTGTVDGYWIRPFVLGNVNSAPQPVFVKARTSWGRPRVGHLFDMIAPGQVRGVSPLAAALTSAHSKRTLQEFNLAAALVQSMTATTVESDLPRDAALRSIATDDPLGAQAPAGISPEAWAKAQTDYYGGDEGVKVNLQPGVITHMMKGDKLVMHRAQAPNSTYDAFDKSLSREAAKAAGGSYEDASGDYSNTSFSAARLAQELPWRINKRRRAAIVEPFYRAAFVAWLEEACETGRIKLPSGAPAFWEATDAYSNAVWRGEGKPVADPLKAAQADILEIENGLSTLEAKLGERGYDFEEVTAQRKAEKDQLTTAGLPYPVPKNREDFTPEDDMPSK
ncbi:phage portal protein [Bradyrhizobium sp. 155]|uniref:phage portal protein n=1 Tax=Bradyrhizobium sp. 155 TaxID=2782629 RepID=UPI001FFEC484|nr:phage portal protein [Bradyrhizobium sp. 155]UPK14466.1 phage portal protein [Bradyrhizobium sp. 155]